MGQTITQTPDIFKSSITTMSHAPGQMVFGYGRGQIFTRSGAFRIPPYVNRIFVSVQGAGGNSGTYAGGGGGGGFACGILNVDSGELYNIVVGIPDIDFDMRESKFGNIITATGGDDGEEYGTDSDSSYGIIPGGVGGVGHGGDYQFTGGAGGSSLISVNGSDKVTVWSAGGGGSAAFNGGGFRGGQTIATSGNNFGGCGGGGIGGAGGSPPPYESNNAGRGGGGGGSGGSAAGSNGGPNILGMTQGDTKYITGETSHYAPFSNTLSYYKFDETGIPLLCRGFGGRGVLDENPLDLKAGSGGGGGGGGSNLANPSGYGGDASDGGFGGGGGGGGNNTESFHGGNGGFGGGGGAHGCLVIGTSDINVNIKGGIGGHGFVIVEW